MFFSFVIALAVLCVSVSAQGKGTANGKYVPGTSTAYGVYEYINIMQWYDTTGSATEDNGCDGNPTHSYSIRPGHCITHYVDDGAGNLVADSTTPSMSYGYMTHDSTHISLAITYFSDNDCQTYHSADFTANPAYRNGCNVDNLGYFAKITTTNTYTPTMNGVSLT